MVKSGLSVDALTLVRGGRVILTDLSFDVTPGEALLVRGPNGVGKSSLLMALAGLLDLEDGRIVHGRPDPDAPVHGHIHYVSQTPAIKSGLSVYENLRFWADVFGVEGADIASALDRAGLGGLDGIDAGLLSTGQTRRLALARLVAVPRTLWLLDEPTNALDAAGGAWVADLVSAHLSGGGMAVIATHLDFPVVGASKTLTLDRRAA